MQSLLLCRQDYSQTHANDDPNLPVQSLQRRQLVFKSAVLNCWIMRWRARLQIVLLSDPFLYLIYNTAHIPIFIIQFGFILALFSKSQHLVCEEMLFALRSLSDVWKEANFWEAIYEVVPHEYPVEFCHRQIKGRASRWRRRLEMKGGIWGPTGEGHRNHTPGTRLLCSSHLVSLNQPQSGPCRWPEQQPGERVQAGAGGYHQAV